MAQRGFTLLELLAVIVIITMAVSVTGMSLVSSDRLASVQATMARWRDLDAQARVAARCEGKSVVMRIDADRHSIVLASRIEELACVSLPLELTAEFEVDDHRKASIIAIDRSGQSPDYAMVLCDEGQKTITRTGVCGLTGWLVNDGEAAR